MDRLSRRKFLKSSALAAVGVLASGCVTVTARGQGANAAAINELSTLPSLRAVAESKGIYFGAAVGQGKLKQDPAFAAAVARECNLIVPENALKMWGLRPGPEKWGFEEPDALLAWTQQNNMKMRGHTLVWHAWIPDWIKAKIENGKAEEVMAEHIRAVMGRYRGKLLSWDVVNEAVNPKDNMQDGLRDSPWLKAMGPSYIEKAFRYAAEADPSAKLVYNDYNTDENVLNLLRRLMDKGVPLHGVGIQSHIMTNMKVWDTRGIRKFCREAKQMGLEVLITEFDVNDTSFMADNPNERDRRIAEITRTYFDAVLAECKPKEILTWGMSDKYTWVKDNKTVNPDRLSVRPLPLGKDLLRKPMWQEIHKALSAL